jgi:glycosyltransferase involved in cell wall biosynthesis
VDTQVKVDNMINDTCTIKKHSPELTLQSQLRNRLLLVLQAPPLPLNQGYRHAAFNDVIQLSRIHDIHILICNGEKLIYDFKFNSYEINKNSLKTIPGVKSITFIEPEVDWNNSLWDRFIYQLSSFFSQRSVLKDIGSELLTAKIIEICNTYRIRDIHFGMTVNLFLDTFSNLYKTGNYRMSFTAHDIDADKTLVRMKQNLSERKFIYVLTNWLVYWILLWKEFSTCRKSQFVITMAYQDFKRHLKRKVKVYFIPPYLHSVKVDKTIKKLPEKPVLTVLGHLSFSASGKGPQIFLENVAVKVKQKVRGSVVRIIGKDASQEVISKCEELGILYQEFVEDPNELWNSITVLASPLMVSKGIRIRILEAAYHGIPVVCTEHSVTGFYNPDKFLRVTNNFDLFADYCIELLSNAESYHFEQERIKKYFDTNLSEEIIRQRWERVWAGVYPEVSVSSFSQKSN